MTDDLGDRLAEAIDGAAAPVTLEEAIDRGRRQQRRRYAKLAAVIVGTVGIAVASFVVARPSDQSRLQVAGTTASATTSSAPKVTTTTTKQYPNGALNLHAVDWKNIAVPGASCFRSQDIQLHNGQALFRDTMRGNPTKPESNGIRYDSLYGGPETYGDLEGSGHDDATIELGCTNNGGTADSFLLHSLAVYSGRSGSLTYLGLVTPQKQPANALPTLLSVRSIAPGTIIVNEYWYGPNDCSGCASGKARTTWSFSAGNLVPIATEITAQTEGSRSSSVSTHHTRVLVDVSGG